MILLMCLVCPKLSIVNPAEAAACGTWWEPCCPWWDKSAWDASCPREKPQAAKDAAKVWSSGANAGILYLKALLVLQTADCIANGADKNHDPCVWAALLFAAKRGLEISKNWADSYADDDFYPIPHEPQIYDITALDLPDCERDGSWLREFCAYNVDHAQQIYAYWEAGNIPQAGLHLEYLAYGLAIAADVTGWHEARDAANAIYPVAWEMEQCSDC